MLDGLVDAQAGELDPAVRRGIAREAAMTLLEEGVRFTPGRAGAGVGLVAAGKGAARELRQSRVPLLVPRLGGVIRTYEA